MSGINEACPSPLCVCVCLQKSISASLNTNLGISSIHIRLFTSAPCLSFSVSLVAPVQQHSGPGCMFWQSGSGQHEEQEDSERGRAQHLSQGHHQLQGRLWAGLRSALLGVCVVGRGGLYLCACLCVYVGDQVLPSTGDPRHYNFLPTKCNWTLQFQPFPAHSNEHKMLCGVTLWLGDS